MHLKTHILIFTELFITLQMISDLNTFLNKAVPDTRLTIKKYLDAKFEYLVSDIMWSLLNIDESLIIEYFFLGDGDYFENYFEFV